MVVKKPLLASKKATISIPDVESTFISGGGFPLTRDFGENLATVDDVFTSSEVDRIIETSQSLRLRQARTYGGEDHNIRESSISFLYPGYTTEWIFHRLKDVVLMANQERFGFELFSLEEGIQFTQYEAPSGHYSWHMDKGPGGFPRKLGLTIQLSDGDSYEGGDLEFSLGGSVPLVASREKGSASIFPSYVLHRVSPVTSGTRNSLVAWVSGPPFK